MTSAMHHVSYTLDIQEQVEDAAKYNVKTKVIP
jgi:hypothetical protein